ncbi:hypothetical protein BGW36DRAFT_297538 [Talaromyces proteolyticus]|uniref:DUF7702 domain-containing protein n=1 Tax=Talaromyces proteolyticus TaxID=1131652 RepID=A0AAD4KP43_9EURO|nr:uncharacterized protein BGW36DRAFT_297538 [Talaromyces proteolyticus]KAH8696279.1 hypothetical protein BGW36DRAFT_297538 [Talaromyces proteolyticus]
MGTVDYRDGIAIIQLIVFPVLFVIGILIWKRIGWRAGGKSWRFVVTLALLRIIGSICTLVTINNTSERIYIAAIVCELIGVAPLLLTYIGLLGQIDTEQNINPRLLRLVTLAGFLGLILGIVGVSILDDKSSFHPNSEIKAAMGIFLAVFVIMSALAVWLGFQLWFSIKVWQKKLFFAIILSWPFLLVRLVYSAIGDYSTNHNFTPGGGNDTIYLCMSVLEEIVAMALCVGFGMSAMVDKKHEEVALGETMADPKTAQV